ncbi:EAL domain-containing protein [Neobacillus sp. OS1-32]|uniref:EAL domain-containing protein n=1 Tax=Neobacillus paridis TaxID=2803862 RepID=A0ABS1TNS0_9BACI|nr:MULTISPECIES: EAL domain-containing protein [Neobacillus]MBL4952922.1 EAL domain-containing protein [Neobacillus paridis]WML31558.1 EAL domain-containing protein [Neobacillus sp. OS1-32]
MVHTSREWNIETDLKKAIDRNEFRLYYQPKVNLLSRKIIGVEALIRWFHPEKGLIPPLDFIPVAEQTGLIIPIGEWVLRTACLQNKAWQTEGYLPMVMSVNLSVRQLYQPRFVQLVEEILTETDLKPDYLELEITESMMADTNHALPTINGLKELGVQISLDDFGTGFSALFYLKEFPINKIKIDQSFIRNCTSNTNDTTIVKTIIAMAHQLQMGVIAEGIESTDQLKFLQENFCNHGQGYLFSKPLLPDELVGYFGDIEEIVSQVGVPKEVKTKKLMEEMLLNVRYRQFAKKVLNGAKNINSSLLTIKEIAQQLRQNGDPSVSNLLVEIEQLEDILLDVVNSAKL